MMDSKKDLIEQYKAQRQQSAQWHQRARKVFTSEGATHFARIFDPYRPYVTHADGVKKWDLDGNEYIDYVLGHGALLLGHNHQDVVSAVQEQIARGVLYGENHTLEVEWAELVQEMMPGAERVLFFPCGNEANMMAVRLARVYTGRSRVLRFEKHYHGWSDELASPAESGVNHDQVTIIPQNDLDRLEKELSSEKYAVLFTEAGGAFLGGKTPIDPDFVRQIPEMAKKYGTVWALDEVVTGFRVAPGGWQSIIGVEPDLTSLGKCIGGGLSAGALVGKSDIFEPMRPGGVPGRQVMHGGTWNANALTAAAGVAACKLLRTGEPQQKAERAAAHLRREGNKILKEKGISGAFYGKSSINYLYLGPVDFEPADDTLPPVTDPARLTDPAMLPVFNRLLLHLIQRGVSNLMGSIFIFSLYHTKDVVDQTLYALDESLQAMLDEGSLKTGG